MNESTIEELFDVQDEFLAKLRLLEGFDDELYKKYKRMLLNVAEELSGQKFVVKELANGLIDVSPALIGIHGQYKGEIAARIEESIIEIQDLIRECFS